MARDILAQVRKDGMKMNTTVSEVEMQQTHEGVQQLFKDLQALKAKIAKEKQEAAKMIDAKYADELTKLQQKYAMCMKLMR